MVTLTKELPQLEVDLFSRVIDRPWPQKSHSKLHKSPRSFANEFEAPVITDLAPSDAACDWCGQTAERRLTALGGSLHNTTGVFCSPCGQRFVDKIVHSQHKH